MYTIPTPRTLAEVLALIIPPTHSTTASVVFDAMRVYPEFHSRTLRNQPTHDKDGREYSVLGNQKFWKQAEAETVLVATFGEDACDRVSHFVAAYRDQATDKLDDAFMFAVAIIIWGGTDKRDWFDWDMHDRAATNGKGLGYLCPAYWIARWGKESLNALVAAGFSADEIKDVYFSESLPDPEAVATLIALRANA